VRRQRHQPERRVRLAPDRGAHVVQALLDRDERVDVTVQQQLRALVAVQAVVRRRLAACGGVHAHATPELRGRQRRQADPGQQVRRAAHHDGPGNLAARRERGGERAARGDAVGDHRPA